MPRPEDIHIGQRIRQRRHVLGMNQKEVAEKIGTKFQQLQKYETGVNRVSGSRLCDLSQALNVPVAYFFEGLGDDAAPAAEVRSGDEATLLEHFRQVSQAGKASVLSILASMVEPAPTSTN